MKTWHAAAVRKSFEFAARSAEQYASELRQRFKRDPKRDSLHARSTHDEHLAKWFVYDSLANHIATESRAALIAEMKRLLADPPSYNPAGCFSRVDFKAHWILQMTILLRKTEAS